MDAWSVDTEHTSSSVRFSRVLSAVLAFFVFLRVSGINFFSGIPQSKRTLIRTSMSTPFSKVRFSLFNEVQKY